MDWATIWEAVNGLIKRLKNKDDWKMSTNGKSAGPITAVSVKESGVRFEFEEAGSTRRLEAMPAASGEAEVKVDGVRQEKARLVFSLRHQFAKPLIAVFEFKGVQIGEEKRRYRFDCPK